MSGGEFAAIERLRDAVACLDPVPPAQRYRMIPTISTQDDGSDIQIDGSVSVKTPIYDSAVMSLMERVRALFDDDSEASLDIPALLAAVRERDNTIARVRALAGDPSDVDPLSGFKGQPDDMPGVDDFIDHGAWLQKAALRAALDPQETP